MPEPTIVCPKCKTEIKLTESLAAPLIETTRREFEARIAEQDAVIALRETAIREKEVSLSKASADLERQIAERVEKERTQIAVQEAKKAKVALDSELGLKAAEIGNLQDLLKQRDEKLAEAQKSQAELARQRRELEDEKRELEVTVAERVRDERGKIAVEAERKVKLALQSDMDAQSQSIKELEQILVEREQKLAAAQAQQAELLKKQRELDDAKREMELNIEKRVQEGLDASRALARKEAEESLGLKLAESQHTIASMQKQIEDLKRRAEQGSQQLQGEVQELELEAILSLKFPSDTITPVPKGEFGGDVLQSVKGPLGQTCGTILWESKRTKNWSDGWLAKLKTDQFAAKAELAVIVTQVLPKDVDTFHLIDGIWVTHPRAVLPVAIALRNTLIEVSCARQASEGQQGKMELVYEYLTGPRFRQRVQAIAEAFSTMQDDLNKEKRAMIKQWAKRETQLVRAIGATAGMYGDFQGIAGRTLQEVDALALLEHDDGGDEPADE